MAAQFLTTVSSSHSWAQPKKIKHAFIQNTFTNSRRNDNTCFLNDDITSNKNRVNSTENKKATLKFTSTVKQIVLQQERKISFIIDKVRYSTNLLLNLVTTNK